MADVLVTGGAGFIGSHLVDLLLERRSDRVTVIDRLSSGGSKANLERHEADPLFRFVHGDVTDRALIRNLVEQATAVIHAAAESHVDRSIDQPGEFVLTNVVGTEVVLDACRANGVRMLMVSTDEVYGAGDPAGGLFAEDHPVAPRSPYSATKAAADLLCRAYCSTYGMDVTIVRGTNAYGPRQIERVVPTYSIAAIEGRPIPVYGRGEQRREFLHVRDWAGAALLVLEQGEGGVVYNIGAGHELSNLDLARRICAAAGAPESLIRFVADRPGHDFRYGVASDRVMALGWRPEIPFDDGLKDTVAWYRDHLDWLRRSHPGPIATEPREAPV
jgi:dTDP-glucose 4,6-dehydratase